MEGGVEQYHEDGELVGEKRRGWPARGERTSDDTWFAQLKANLEVLERAAAAGRVEQASPLEEGDGGD